MTDGGLPAMDDESRPQASVVLGFWFDQLRPADWYKKDAALDDLIRRRFSSLHRAASCCELYGWRASPEGRLAEIIVLDQFSRNIFRGDARAFAQDALALGLAQEAVASGVAAHLHPHRRGFLYMPFMHSESSLIHRRAVQLFSEPGLEYSLNFELRHKAIIDRFGRYPHRNQVLGRPSTPEEQRFLEQPGSSF